MRRKSKREARERERSPSTGNFSNYTFRTRNVCFANINPIFIFLFQLTDALNENECVWKSFTYARTYMRGNDAVAIATNSTDNVISLSFFELRCDQFGTQTVRCETVQERS